MNDIQLLYKIKLISATPAECVQFDINLSPPPTKCIWYICILGQSSDNAPDDDDNENDII